MMKSKLIHIGITFLILSSFLSLVSCSTDTNKTESMAKTNTNILPEPKAPTYLQDTVIKRITDNVVKLASQNKLAASLDLVNDTTYLIDPRIATLKKDIQLLLDTIGIRNRVKNMSDLQYEKIQETIFLNEPNLNKLYIKRLYKERYSSQAISTKVKKVHPCLKMHGCVDCAELFAKFKSAKTMDEKISIDDCYKVACQ